VLYLTQLWSNTLTITKCVARGTAPVSLSVPAAPELATLATEFERTHNVVFGSVYGNSPTSVTCLHEMSIFPQIQGGLMRWPDQLGGRGIDAALEAQMRWYGQHAFNGSGYLYNRWDMMGNEQDPITNVKDSSTMFGCIMVRIRFTATC
jgi:hypothetical protein